MTLYERFYQNIIPKLPENLIEFSGGPFYKIYSTLFPFQPRFQIELRPLEINLDAPWGLSSGWADTIPKMNYIKNIGAGIVFSKTITFYPRKGNPHPRLIRLNKYSPPLLINSMGLPNYGLARWISWLKKVGRLPEGYFLSVKGNTIKEWAVLIKKLATYTTFIELNISCPNVSHGIMNLNETLLVFERIFKQIKDVKINLSIKLSPEYSIHQIIKLLNVLVDRYDLVKAVSLFNTFPIDHPYLGNIEKKGGLSGMILYKKLVHSLKEIRKIYSMKELLVFASGGIISGNQALEIWKEFKAFPLTMTGFLAKGPSLFKDWYLSFKI